MCMIGRCTALVSYLLPAMNAEMPAVGAQVGTGAFLGFSMGYFMKKMAKIFMLGVGMLMVVAAYLELNGLLTVHWNGLAASVGGVFRWLTRGIGDGSLLGFSRALIGAVPLGGSFAAFALLGFKYG